MAARAEAVEPALAAIWADVLGVDHVSPDDDFFALGGTSLLAMQIVARASDEFGVDVALDALFEAPTVAGLARRIDGAGAHANGSRAHAADGGPKRTGRKGLRWLRRSERHPQAPARGKPALSPLQASAWAIQRYNDGARPHVGDAFTLEGALDVPALEQALTELVARHEVLRTVFPLVDHRPVPRVLPPEPVHISVTTLARGSRKSAEAECNALVDAGLADPFDFEHVPPLRIRLIRRAAHSHVLILLTHEIVCDGWGFEALTRELSQLYDAFAAGRPSPFAEPPLQYADALRAQQGRRAGGRGREHWERVLPELPITLPLPFEAGGMPAADGGSGQARATIRIPERLAERLRAFAREEAATSFMLHLAAFLAVLHLRTGEPRVRVTSPAANRNRTELEGVIGFFAQLLPLWADFDDDPSLRTLLRRVRESTLQAFAHAEDLPESHGTAELNGVRGLMACGAVFRLWDATLERRPKLAGIRSQVFREAGEGGNLGLIVTEQPGKETVADLSSSALDRATVEGMLAQYREVLEQMAEDADRRVRALGAQERARERNAAGDAGERCLHDLVSAQAQRNPDAVAVRAGETALTYGELEARAQRLAAALRSHGVGPGARVGLALAPSADLVVAMLAVLQAGAACVPAEAFEAVPQIDALLTAGGTPPPGAPAARTVLDVDAPEVGEPANLASGDVAQPGDLAFLVMTGGVTGAPKPVELTHRALVHAAIRRQHACRLTPQDRSLHVPGPGAHAWTLAPWAALASGGQVVVPGHVPDAGGPGTAAWLEAQDATVAVAPPALAASCLSGGGLERTALRTLVPQGWGPLQLPEGLRRGRPAVLREYGLAETGGLVLIAPVAGSAAAGDPLAAELPAAGGIEAQICDAQGNALAPCAIGELRLAGPGVARGGPLETGDLARRGTDGTIEVFGRLADEIRFRGFRLTLCLHDLEVVLAAHPGVAAAAGFWDERDETLVACLVPRRAQPPEPQELDRWLQEHMRDWVLPRRYLAVEAIPLRADGSPDRAALARQDGQTLGDDPRRTAPQTATEKQLVAIWRQVLGRRDVGVHENLFALGGMLIDGVEAAERARAAGIPLHEPDLMLRPTIAELAALADERR